MASLMEDLLDVLEKEEAQYETLIALGDEKREAVIKADIAKLDDVTIREQDDEQRVLRRLLRLHRAYC